MSRLACLALVALAFMAPAASAQDPIEAELGHFWRSVVSSVENWRVDAQQATCPPDAIVVSGDADSQGTHLVVGTFAQSRADDSPPPVATLAFRFSARAHSAVTAHEVGVYRRQHEGEEPACAGVQTYLVEKGSRWYMPKVPDWRSPQRG